MPLSSVHQKVGPFIALLEAQGFLGQLDNRVKLTFVLVSHIIQPEKKDIILFVF
jgi:hypothetical protein